MKTQTLKPAPSRLVRLARVYHALALLCLATLLAPSVQGQSQVYRIVGPDGKVSFSDQPPPVGSGSSSKSSAANVGTPGSAASAGLPFELRQLAAKFPVTLYTSENCAPCGGGRSMLTSRGIPFAEKTVNTFEDGEALKRLSGASSLPLLTIGSQHLKGFSDAEWTQFLDAAGYPASIALPAAYRRPAATALVLTNTAPVAAPAGAAQAPAPTATQAVDTPINAPASSANPSGIRF